jgi:hypothetical protein
MVTVMETSALAAFFTKLIPGALGAAIAAWRIQRRSLVFKLLAFFFAVFLAHYVGNGLIAVFNFKALEVQDLIKVGIGLFGIRIITAVETQIAPAVRAMRARFIGRDPESQKGDL